MAAILLRGILVKMFKLYDSPEADMKINRNEYFTSRTTATFIRKSICHIGVFYKTEKCILSYHYGIADVLFILILSDVGLF